MRSILAAFFLSSLLALTGAQAQDGTLRIVTDPGDARIYVNGDRKGNSPTLPGHTFAIRLAEGEYLISAESEQNGQTWYGEKTVFVGGRTLQTVSLNLSADLSKMAAGDTFSEGQDLPTMVVIAAGSFIMGSPVNEQRRFDDEGPQKQITIQRAFALSQHEVTFRQWDACVAAGGCSHKPDDMGWSRGNRPVVDVSWDDVQEYIRWINSETDGGYDLPSEAQWEYAARAGTTTPFSTGPQISTDLANFNGEGVYNGSRKGIFRGQTVAVGTFEPNPWGLYETHGNVWEWTKDCWTDDLRDKATDGAANSDGDCSGRILRGGSWRLKPQALRSAYRDRDAPSYRANDKGFRLFKEL